MKQQGHSSEQVITKQTILNQEQRKTEEGKNTLMHPVIL